MAENEVIVSENNELTEGKVAMLMDLTYEKSINGLPGADTAYEIAEDYTREL